MSQQARITVEASHPIARIRPELYSQFIEPLGKCVYEGIWVADQPEIPQENGMRTFALDALRRLGPAAVRWPGGCFADQHHWREGIGDPAQRPVRLNLWWGGLETHAFGTHEYFDFCERIGAFPYICGNVGSGTVAEMRDWLEYCNAEGPTTLTEERRKNGSAKPLGVRFWGVGNENYGCGGHMSPSDYAAEYRKFATQLRRVDPTVELIAAGYTADYNRKLLEALITEREQSRELIDHVAVHRFFRTGGHDVEFSEEDYYSSVAESLLLDDDIVKADGLFKNYEDPSKRIGLVIDEWGTWHSNAPRDDGLFQRNTIRDAVVAAGCLNTFTNWSQRVVLTSTAQAINVLTHVIAVDGRHAWLTPIFHVFEMVRNHVGNDALTTNIECPNLAGGDGSSGGVPQISASASADPERRSGVVCAVNRHISEPADCTVAFADLSVRSASASLLSESAPNVFNDAANPDRVTPSPTGVDIDNGRLRMELPPHSVALFSVELT